MGIYQGNLDGLCGQYAIANAFGLCGFDEEDCFQSACRGLAHRRWPMALWEGTTLGDMKRMIARCRRELDVLGEVTVHYPLLLDEPKADKSYWRRFDAIFENMEVRCGIMGLTRPTAHWIVVQRSGRSLEFVDSNPESLQVRKYRKSIHAGKRPRSKNQWLVDRKELITFTVVT